MDIGHFLAMKPNKQFQGRRSRFAAARPELRRWASRRGSMRFLATLVVALALVSPKASAALSCEEFLTFPKTNQQLFVRGLVDGKATVFGVTDTAARLLKKAAKSADEKTGIDKMHDFPQNFMSKGCCISNEEITEKIIKGCTAKPDRPVGNMLTDVMSGAL